MREVGRGAKVLDHEAVRGRWRTVAAVEDLLDLVQHGASGVVAVVADDRATFPAGVYRELTAMVCTSGTPSSHVGIVARERNIPCIVSASFPDGPPPDGTEVVIDCSGPEGVIRA